MFSLSYCGHFLQRYRNIPIGLRKSPLALSPLAPSALTQFIFMVFFAARSCKKYHKNKKSSSLVS
jgi:hypothetical protein